MIEFQKFTLANGLRVLLHEDNSTPLVAVNVLYDVGSRDENPERTGFAHLFEHLMFGGSKNAPNYDDPIQNAGGENNAFTNNDMTNFYASVPAENLETLLWLESDRMLALKINKRSLATQRKVVVEEFKETTLNEPYGDIWHHLSDMAYKIHPYRWPVIGLVPRHVEEATLDEVKSFYETFYAPNNAILTVAGNFSKIKTENGNENGNENAGQNGNKNGVEKPFSENSTKNHASNGLGTEGVKSLVEKWFAPIPSGNVPPRRLPPEPPQTAPTRREVTAAVPIDALYMTFHAPARTDADYYALDLLTDVLASGTSSRFYRKLLKDKRLVSEIDCSQLGNIDPSLVIIDAKPADGVTLETLETAIWTELELLKTELIAADELQKLKNRAESQQAFGDAGALNKAMNLAFLNSSAMPI